MGQSIIIANATYPDVEKVNCAKTGGGLAKFVDISGTTATAADVQSGKAFYLADGSPETGSYLWNFMGDGAECIDNNVHSFSDTLDNTGYSTWAPATSAQVIVTSVNKTARAINMADYDYLLRWQFTADIAYSEGATTKSAVIRHAIELYQAIIRRPSSLTNLQVPTYNGNTCVTMFTAPIVEYYSSSGTRTVAYTASYGFYIGAVAATFSSSTSNTPNLTIKTPSISARCSNTYLSVANASAVDQANSTLSLRGELWRMDVGSSVRKMYENAVYLFNHPLT